MLADQPDGGLLDLDGSLRGLSRSFSVTRNCHSADMGESAF